jgi:hypothetical protein
VQPLAAGGDEAPGLVGGVAVEHRGDRHVSAQQAHALAVFQIYGGEQDHRPGV